jgi:hypothetical protein
VGVMRAQGLREPEVVRAGCNVGMPTVMSGVLIQRIWTGRRKGGDSASASLYGSMYQFMSRKPTRIKQGGKEVEKAHLAGLILCCSSRWGSGSF